MINKFILSGHVLAEPEFFPLEGLYKIKISVESKIRISVKEERSISTEHYILIPKFLFPESLGVGDKIYVEGSSIPDIRTVVPIYSESNLWCNVFHIISPQSTLTSISTAV